MKKYSLLLVFILLIFAGCKKTTTQNNPEEKKGAILFTSGFNLPDVIKSPTTGIDWDMDINDLSLQELRLLHSYLFAKHGLHFSAAEIYAYYQANTDWYESLVEELWDEGKLPLSYNEVTLTREEQVFVDRIEKRMAELGRNNFINQGDYRLGNVDNIINLYQFSEYDSLFVDKLRQNNFVIASAENRQLFHLYEQNDYRQIPSFITTDLYLQAFHMYFSYTLKILEQQEFIPVLNRLCRALYDECIRIAQSETDPDIKNRAEYNAVYYAVPYYLLTGKELSIPEQYKKDFQTEIFNINQLMDNSSRYFSSESIPYSLFKPRGHYTRKPEMEAYFKAMIWLQIAPFCREETEQLKHTVFSAFLLNTALTQEKKPLMDLYQSIYEPIVFLIGLPDNLSVMDIADFLKKENIRDLQTALSDETVNKVNNMLLELSKTRNQIKPKIEITCSDKIIFMPQSYLIDNDVLQNLVDIQKNSKRSYPKGLDVFAAFGSIPAADLLNNFYKEKENWSEYPGEMLKMQTKFKNYNNWNASMYNKWIESLLALQKTDKNYPEFMQTKAWDCKNLNTSLASWAELKHDAILYAEQPMGAECGGGDFPPLPVVKGFVEPNLRFWNKLAEMISLSQKLLEKHELLSPDLKGKTEQLSDYVNFLIKVTKKELAKQELDENEYRSIQYMGSSIEYFTLSVIDPELFFFLDDWSLVKGPDKSIAVVADIYTRNIPYCPKNGILHVATGNANTIYVVVEIGGYLYLTRGSTFSYYEFIQPPGTRLTDEEWQQMLEEKKAPPVPDWMKNKIIHDEPQIDERIFYSSGC
jgi:hypothetical protein